MAAPLSPLDAGIALSHYASLESSLASVFFVVKSGIFSGLSTFFRSAGLQGAPVPELARLQEELALLTTYTTDTIYRLRYDTMQYDYISPGVERLLGYTADELKATNFRSLIVETRIVKDDMRPVDSFEPLESSRKRGEVSKWQADYLMKTKDGRHIWVSDISYPWFGPGGDIIGSIGSLRDISERVAAEERVRLESERMANTDSLTGLNNRRMFFMRLEEELKRLKRSHEELAVLLIDIDHFKKVNMDFGQKTGDMVIHGIAQIVASCLRETDIGARIGGEEFGVILPDTPASGAFWVAERIRSTVSRHIFHFGADEHLMGCTVSIGVAGARFDDNTDAGTLYALADSRLYIAKQTGRNQVSMDEVAEA